MRSVSFYIYCCDARGEVAEWSKALAWKVSERLIPVPRVQIPSSPPFLYRSIQTVFLYLTEGWPSGRRRATRNRLGGAELSRGFKSHPLRQKTKYWQYEYHFMRRVVREVYGERLEAVCGDEPPEVQILYSPPFFSFNIFQFYKNPLNKEQQPKNHSISQ